MLTTTDLANLLSLPVDALGMKPFADTEMPAVDKEILFTGSDIYTYSELMAMHKDNLRILEMAYASEASMN